MDILDYRASVQRTVNCCYWHMFSSNETEPLKKEEKVSADNYYCIMSLYLAATLIIINTLPIIRSNNYYNQSIASSISYAFFENIPKLARGRTALDGTPTEIIEFPYIGVLISDGQAATCSGIVFKAKWILTAGHCITRHIKQVAYNYNKPEEVRARIDLKIKHPHYHLKEENQEVIELRHDIGLVHYNETFKLELSEDVLPLSFSFNTADNLFEYEVASFAYSADTNYSGPGVLWKRNISLTDCPDFNSERFICGYVLSPSSPGGACPGGSGGAVVVNRFTVIGINSLSPASCPAGLPGTVPSMFVDIYRYLPWIDSVISVDLFALATCLRNDARFIFVALLLALGY